MLFFWGFFVGAWVKYFLNICKRLTSYADALYLIGIWLKIINVQLSSNLCQHIWKHTNRIPDSEAISRCRMYGNSPLRRYVHFVDRLSLTVSLRMTNLVWKCK